MISGIDLEIGKIRAELERKGLDKNTVIILMGDNGYFLGERQFAGKWLLYDNSVRVPLMIYDPRNIEHQDIDEMALNIDVPSTILDLAGVEIPKAWQGKSLLPLVNKKAKSLERDTVLIEHLWEFEHIPPSEGIRTKEWKYFRYVNDKSYEELYNLLEDPKEINNLSSDENYNDVLEELRKKCDELIAENGDSYSREPTGLEVEFVKPEVPRLSWVNPKTVLSQTAYQFLVASSKENIELNIGDVWNSGRIENSSSEEIGLQEAKLKKGKTYYWKVRIYDEDNRLSAYSEPKIFKFLNQ